MGPGSPELLLLRKLGRHAWRAAWAIIAIQVLATLGGIAALRVLPKRYRSSTTIRVERGQIINPLTRGLAVTSQMEERIRSIREEILSRDYFLKVVTRLKLLPPEATPVQLERLVDVMIQSTEISYRQREGDTFQIAYAGTDPKEVRDVTNLLAGFFIEESLANKAGEAGSAVEFLQGQLEVYRGKLEQAEAALRHYEEQHPDMLPANRTAQLARVEQLRASLIEVQNNLRQTTIQRDLLRGQLSTAEGAPPASESPPGLTVPNPLQAVLREKEAALRRLLIDYSESYPDVVALRAEIAQLEAEIAAHPTVPSSQVPTRAPATLQDALGIGQLQQLEVQVSALAAREEQIQREISRYERKVQGIPEVEQELARLRRDYDVNNEIYNNFLRRLEEARVTQQLEESKQGDVFRILQAAALPMAPFSPKPFQVVLAGIGAGLALSAALVYLLALRDTSFQSAAEIQAVLGLRVFVALPRHVAPRVRTLASVKAILLAAAAAAYAAGVAAFLFLRSAR